MTEGNLSETYIQEQLKTIPGWTMKNGKLVREFTFSDFVEAFAFMTELAIVSEKLDHHPEWLNVYNKLYITLSTHDTGGLTEKDLEWATRCNQRYNQQM
ncbi:MAG: 4a-hydroxytetrahydrobiopterin dehydratase [Bdellovibrionota bacterium]|jgi:4a-hydroxytetrahydrobiopterin dehydratase